MTKWELNTVDFCIIQTSVGYQEEVLQRIASLRNEVGAFLKAQKHELSELFSDNEWIAELLFLADFFSHLIQLNTSMQGKDKILLDVSEDIITFEVKWSCGCMNETREDSCVSSIKRIFRRI